MYTTYHTNGCLHCGMGHTGTCPRVRAMEYYPDGSLKRVEYFESSPVFLPATTTPVVFTPLGSVGNDLRKPVTS